MPPELLALHRLLMQLQQRASWLPDWALVVLIVGMCAALGWLANQLVFAVLKWTVRRRDVFWRGLVGRARLKVRLAVLIVAVAIGVTVSPLAPEPSEAIRQALLFLFILVVGWMVSGAVDMAVIVYLRRFNVQVEDNLIARKHLTQARILQRLAGLLIGVVTLGLALLTIGAVRQWGLSLLASAGVVGIVAGFALQPLLTNMIAGVQIATSQPIRLDDAVVVEGEWGHVEEITSTYVVVRLWDWRRMILPLSYFISKPFQNWTRDSARLIGTVFLYVDFEAPMDRLRARLEEVCRASPLWDGDVVSLQVTEVTERVAQVRCLASARNAGAAFDLRCEIREKMLAFMRDDLTQALPRDRLALEGRVLKTGG